jgi:tetratricopeptide (TPR) repeat protein
MPNYVWSALDGSGKRIVERVKAATAAEAKAQMVAKGYRELTLKADEFMEAGRAQVECGFEVPPLTAEEELRYRDSKWAPVLDAIWKLKGSILLSLAILGWGYWHGQKLTMILGAVGLLALPVLFLWFGLPGIYFARLNRAKVAFDWNGVLALVKRLEAIQRLTKTGPGPIELARCRSQALAALGRLDHAVAKFAQLENHTKLPRWQFYSHLSDIYESGHAYEKATEYAYKAVEALPESATTWLDYAFRLARYRRDNTGARAALLRVEQLELAELGQPWVALVRGLIAVNEADFATAKTHFDQALTGYEARRQFDLIHSLIRLTKAYLCWVNGQLGNSREAAKLFAEVEAWLLKGNEEELLQNCRRALGKA